MVIHIGMAGDWAIKQETVRKRTAAYFRSRRLPCQISVFADNRRMAARAEQMDVMFFQLGQDGNADLELAGEIRRRNPKAVLVLVSSCKDRAIWGYQLNAADFLQLPLPETAFHRALNRIWRRLGDRGEDKIVLKNGDGLVILSLQEICHIEVSDHQMRYYTEKGNFEVRGQLCTVEKQLLEPPFFFCSRSSIVNIRYVDRIDQDSLWVHGIQVPISRAKKKELKELMDADG